MQKAINARGELVDLPEIDPGKAHAANATTNARRIEQNKTALAGKAQVELTATDHWAMPDYDKPLTDERKAYREALRAIVRNPDPSQPFPVKPA